MAIVNTVLGPIETSMMGFTLSHEHIIGSSAGIGRTYPEFLDRKSTIEEGVRQLRSARSEGVTTIVDVTTLDLGRDIRMLKEVSLRSKVQIIAATGIWLDIPRVFWNSTPDDVAALFIREIHQGIERTGIKPGVIKVATGPEGVTRQGELILRAAARAHKATGVPITTHTGARERVGEQQLRIFKEEGVSPSRIYIGHSNDTTDMEYLLGLLKDGAWLGLDHFPGGGVPGSPNLQERAELIKRLVDAGFAHRILLSHDWVVTHGLLSRDAEANRTGGSPDGFLFISRRLLPLLSSLGVREKDICQIILENPRNFFDGS